MISVNGRPFLEYLVEQLREQGIRRLLLMTGYLGDQIEHHFRDGRRFGVEIGYSRGPVEWQTGRRVWEARGMLDERFLLLYSDNFLPFNLARLTEFHVKHAGALSLLLSTKARGNIRVDANGWVERYDAGRSSEGLDHVEIGYMIVERDMVLGLIDDPDVGFSVLLGRLANGRKLSGLVAGDRYHSISDPERWKLAERYLAGKRILLLDRDGTLNLRPPQAQYIARWEEFRWIPGAIEGLEALTRAGFSFALISNQAGIARGILTRQQVDEINSRLIDELAARGVRILRAYVCPHDWNEGCDCRKPEPGMLFQASRELLFRLDRTLYVGDDRRDCQAAFRAGCEAVFVGDDKEIADLRSQEYPAHVAPSLDAAVPWIRSRFEQWERAAVVTP